MIDPDDLPCMQVLTIALPITDPQLGCADEVDTGVTPNEYGTWLYARDGPFCLACMSSPPRHAPFPAGTWLYGRNGWCNGREVVPWVIDLSEDIGLTGETALMAPDDLPCMQVLITARFHR